MRAVSRTLLALFFLSAPPVAWQARAAPCATGLQPAPAACCGSACTCGPEAPCLCPAPPVPAPSGARTTAGLLASATLLFPAADGIGHPADSLSEAAVRAPAAASSHPAPSKHTARLLELFCTLLV
jgi:hypothetical protein